MASGNAISITPEDLRRCAQQSNSIKTEIMDQLQRLYNTIHATTDNWSGQAQISFVASFDDLYKQISTSLPQVVEGVESQLNNAANIMEEADAQIAGSMR